MINPNELSSYEKHILEKLDRVRPSCGEDDTKERYRYIQWVSCKNAVIEAMKDNASEWKNSPKIDLKEVCK